ncbi:hypothetical protein BKA66DRAFT_246780 [Pyrenochaeta sp. MPI-SDFR-AT-0127]|nr:hypothetical protein BKA66DRAFT_246780 [Pyrenochaeta sp. MPI-SDFR-AT-0127]
MPSILQIASCVLALSQVIIADTPPTSPGPFVSCSGIAVSSCPASSGCCTAGACCGNGCCALTDACIYPNTPQAACCPFSDPTLCGSKSTSSPAPSTSDTPSNEPVDDPTCTRIRNCVVPAGTWTCLLGKPCGFFKGECGTCPALLASNSVSPSNVFSSSQSALSPTSSLTDSSSTSRTTVPTSAVPSPSPASNDASPSFYVGLVWRAVVAFLPAYVVAA